MRSIYAFVLACLFRQTSGCPTAHQGKSIALQYSSDDGALSADSGAGAEAACASRCEENSCQFYVFQIFPDHSSCATYNRAFNEEYLTDNADAVTYVICGSSTTTVPTTSPEATITTTLLTTAAAKTTLRTTTKSSASTAANSCPTSRYMAYKGKSYDLAQRSDDGNLSADIGADAEAACEARCEKNSCQFYVFQTYPDHSSCGTYNRGFQEKDLVDNADATTYVACNNRLVYTLPDAFTTTVAATTTVGTTRSNSSSSSCITGYVAHQGKAISENTSVDGVWSSSSEEDKAACGTFCQTHGCKYYSIEVYLNLAFCAIYNGQFSEENLVDDADAETCVRE